MFLGIVGVDKTNLSKLGDENDKLRQKLSDVQRENIKLKEVSLLCIIGERTPYSSNKICNDIHFVFM